MFILRYDFSFFRMKISIFSILKNEQFYLTDWQSSVACNHESMWRRVIVIMDFDFYTGDCGLIPTYGNSLGKWMNLHPDQPMPCEGNWVVSPRCWQDIDLHSVYIIAEMGFSASCNSTIYTLYTAWYQLRQRNNSNENHAVITLKNFNTKDNLTQLSSKAHK